MYSDQWVKHCVSREPVGPARLASLALVLPSALDWSEMPDTPDSQKLLSLRAGQELRPPGPVRFRCGRWSARRPCCFVGADMPADDWKTQKANILREFQVLATYFHQHILRIYGNDAESQMIVSARELDCLKWVAAGKTAWEASVILGISERTVRFHLNAAREKLNCLTTTQAVAKAVSQQLIEAS